MHTNMRKAREAVDLSQKQVALTLKVSAPTVSDWESGKTNPTAENLKKLALLYKAPIDYLLGLTDDSLYIESNNQNIRTTKPISILSSQYHISSDVLSAITGASRDDVDSWLSGTSKTTHEENKVLADFFELPIQNLEHGIIPLFPKESVQLRVCELTNLRYGSYGKDDDFSESELAHIKKYRTLDEYGKEAVDSVLVVERKRCYGQEHRPIQLSAAARTGIDIEKEDFSKVAFSSEGDEIPE